MGEGGCLQVAKDVRRSAGLDFAGSPWSDAQRLFARACEGGSADGCVAGAEMLDAPCGDSVKGAPNDRIISDKELSERQRLLTRACKLGSEAGCRRLGDITIGKNADVALRAYDEACRMESQPPACKGTRKHDVQVFEQYRVGCKKTLADDCTTLGNLVYRVDVPRARRLFFAEGELRGVSPLVGGPAQFVRLRASEARTAPEPHSAEPHEGGAASGDAVLPVRIEAVTVDGRLPKSGIERAVRNQTGELSACEAEGASAKSADKIVLELVVDQTGDIWRTSIVETNTSEAFGRCVVKVLSGVAWPRPINGIAKVRFALVFGMDERRKRAH